LALERGGLRLPQAELSSYFVCLGCAWCCKLFSASLYRWPYGFINLKLGIFAFCLKKIFFGYPQLFHQSYDLSITGTKLLIAAMVKNYTQSNLIPKHRQQQEPTLGSDTRLPLGQPNPRYNCGNVEIRENKLNVYIAA
jgi:hypothetical protein